MKLRGLSAVVTGAGNGIGRAIAEELAARGCQVALWDIDDAAASAVAAAIANRGGRALAQKVDVSDPASVESAAARLRVSWGAVEILVNNAGVSVAGRFDAVPLADLHWIFGVNFWGAVHCTRALLPLLCAAPQARLVYVLSGFALYGFPSKTAYCSTKFALRGLGEALRSELHGTSVRVVAVYPPAVATQIVQRGRSVNASKQQREAEFLAEHGMPLPQVAARMVRAIEQGSPRVLIGGTNHLIDLATRLAPTPMQRLIGALRDRIPFV